MYIEPPFDATQPVLVKTPDGQTVQGKIIGAAYNSQDFFGTLTMAVRIGDGRSYSYTGKDIGKTLFLTLKRKPEPPPEQPLDMCEPLRRNKKPARKKTGNAEASPAKPLATGELVHTNEKPVGDKSNNSETLPVKPLTIDELIRMDGKPVWDRDGNCYLINLHYNDSELGRRPCGVNMSGEPTSLLLLKDVGVYKQNIARHTGAAGATMPTGIAQ